MLSAFENCLFGQAQQGFMEQGGLAQQAGMGYASGYKAGINSEQELMRLSAQTDAEISRITRVRDIPLGQPLAAHGAAGSNNAAIGYAQKDYKVKFTEFKECENPIKQSEHTYKGE